ncbi:hypothetical protein PENTCL1PPCAC_18924, partial [Pristionchus entomophagus]
VCSVPTYVVSSGIVVNRGYFVDASNILAMCRHLKNELIEDIRLMRSFTAFHSLNKFNFDSERISIPVFECDRGRFECEWFRHFLVLSADAIRSMD